MNGGTHPLEQAPVYRLQVLLRQFDEQTCLQSFPYLLGGHSMFANISVKHYQKVDTYFFQRIIVKLM